MRKLRFVTNLLLTVSFIAVLFRKIQNRLKLKIPRIYALYEKLTHEHAVLSNPHDFNSTLKSTIPATNSAVPRSFTQEKPTFSTPKIPNTSTR